MKCEDCHFYIEGQFYPICYRYPREIMASAFGHCHEFRPKHNCERYERVVIDRPHETVYECVICKHVRIEVNRER